MVENPCRQSMKIVYYYDNGYFHQLISGQQRDNPSKKAVSFPPGKYKRCRFVHPMIYYFIMLLDSGLCSCVALAFSLGLVRASKNMCLASAVGCIGGLSWGCLFASLAGLFCFCWPVFGGLWAVLSRNWRLSWCFSLPSNHLK